VVENAKSAIGEWCYGIFLVVKMSNGEVKLNSPSSPSAIESRNAETTSISSSTDDAVAEIFLSPYDHSRKAATLQKIAV